MDGSEGGYVKRRPDLIKPTSGAPFLFWGRGGGGFVEGKRMARLIKEDQT